MVKELNLIFGVQGSIFTNDICCGNIMYLPKLPRLGGYLGEA